jgi:hypothetical protein
MKRYRFLTCAVVCLAAMTVLVYAADMSIGTWKLNLSKSRYDPANLAPKSQTVKNEAAADGVKQVADIVDSTGKAIHTEYTAKYDGKDYPVKGDPNRDTVALKKIDDYNVEFTNKKGGKVMTTGKVVYSRDGKTRTITTSGTNAQGQKVSNTTVFDKQ